MLTTALEATRGWGSLLNRIGWGAVVTFSFLYFFDVLGPTDKIISAGATPTLSFLFTIIALFFSSNLLGAAAIAIGSLSYTNDRRKRVSLLIRVVKADQPLFISLYKDLLIIYEMIAGFRGSIFLNMLIIAAKLLTIFFSNSFPSLNNSADDPSMGITTIIIAATTLIFSKLIDYGASNSERFLTEALDEYEASQSPVTA